MSDDQVQLARQVRLLQEIGTVLCYSFIVSVVSNIALLIMVFCLVLK